VAGGKREERGKGEPAHLRKLSKVGAWVPEMSKIRYVSLLRCKIDRLCDVHFSVNIWNRISQIILEKCNTKKGGNCEALQLEGRPTSV